MTTDDRFGSTLSELAPRGRRAPRARPPRRGPRADGGDPPATLVVEPRKAASRCLPPRSAAAWPRPTPMLLVLRPRVCFSAAIVGLALVGEPARAAVPARPRLQRPDRRRRRHVDRDLRARTATDRQVLLDRPSATSRRLSISPRRDPPRVRAQHPRGVQVVPARRWRRSRRSRSRAPPRSPTSTSAGRRTAGHVVVRRREWA